MNLPTIEQPLGWEFDFHDEELTTVPKGLQSNKIRYITTHMKKLILIGSVVALLSAGITYAATNAISVPSTSIFLKDGGFQLPVTSFVDGNVKCYIFQAPQAFGSISCVAVK